MPWRTLRAAIQPTARKAAYITTTATAAALMPRVIVCARRRGDGRRRLLSPVPLILLTRFHAPFATSEAAFMQVIPVTAVHRGFGTTSRRDKWWAAPLSVFLGLFAFVVYATWAAFQGDHYTSGRTSRRSIRRSSGGRRRTPGSGPEPDWWPGVAPVLAGAADPAVSRRFPLHLLLLPRRLLQGVLGRSAVVRGRRAAQELPGRELVSR